MALILSYLLYSNFESDMREYRPFYQKLSEHLAVYRRYGAAHDTLIIRDLHENRCFGVKSFEIINRFYVLLWDILAQLSDSSLKYIETRDGAVDYGRNEQTVNTKYGTKIIFTLDDEIQIEYYKEQNQFLMYNLKDQRIDCRVVLELSHVIELANYISKRFNFCNFIKGESNVYIADNFF